MAKSVAPGRRIGLPLIMALVSFTLIACDRHSAADVSPRSADDKLRQSIYKVDGEVKVAVDSDGDGHPDLIKTFRGDQMVMLERDRNLDGRIDWVEKYQDGKLTQLVRDDNYDGLPETINTYRKGKLVIVEHDPDACGTIDRTDYFDETGRLIRSETRAKR